MSSPPSNSESISTAFSLLHPLFQKWIYEQGWTSLHDAQEQAIRPILEADKDVIISAATAAGKTEAAFLPICSALTTSAGTVNQAVDPWIVHNPWEDPVVPAARGIEVLYISPLKALINDQFQRLEMICGRADLRVNRWHGDVSGSAKQKIIRNPSGVLLITPESLEAQFVNRGSSVSALLSGLRYVVIDELHSFLGTPRGAQLQSLLHRVEVAIDRSVPRIGLSATLGDMATAARFIRPNDSTNVVIVKSDSDAHALMLQVRGYRAISPRSAKAAGEADEGAGDQDEIDGGAGGDRLDIADDLFRKLRGTDNLVFANSRRDVELYADLLTRHCERDHVPNEFWAHHGSLSKDAREFVESRLKDGSQPATAICTSTLELGIDIGSVASVAQIGSPPSVAALRQRLGRSGRRDGAAVGRIYITEREIDGRSSPIDELRTGIVQAIAMVNLLLDHWVESPDDPGFNFSTLVQQILSVIAQHGGAKGIDLHRVLCGPGPFELVDVDRITRLLQTMINKELLCLGSDGLLLHGLKGERIVNHYSFYSAFQTPEEWKVVADGRGLGTLPIVQPMVVGGLLIFGGRRWRIVAIDVEGRIVDLTRSTGGTPPNFGGTSGLIGWEVRAQMVVIYGNDDVPAWLDRESGTLLAEGRAAWRRMNLDETVIHSAGNDCLVFPWLGDRALITAGFQLGLLGIQTERAGPALVVHRQSAEQLVTVAQSLLAQAKPDPIAMALELTNTWVDKWDWVLNDELLAEASAARLLDVEAAWKVFEAIATRGTAEDTDA